MKPRMTAREFAEWYFAAYDTRVGTREEAIDLLARITDERDRRIDKPAPTTPPLTTPAGSGKTCPAWCGAPRNQNDRNAALVTWVKCGMDFDRIDCADAGRCLHPSTGSEPR